jgi:hypothetical protein
LEKNVLEEIISYHLGVRSYTLREERETEQQSDRCPYTKTDNHTPVATACDYVVGHSTAGSIKHSMGGVHKMWNTAGFNHSPQADVRIRIMMSVCFVVTLCNSPKMIPFVHVVVAGNYDACTFVNFVVILFFMTSSLHSIFRYPGIIGLSHWQYFQQISRKLNMG